jgi:protein gp37
MASQDNEHGISYLDETWSPLAMRCDRVSAGCANCWHLPMANRMAHNPVISADARAAYAGGAPYLDEQKLMLPLHWKKPRRVGVQFMGDLFHANVPDEWIDRAFAVMALCPAHKFLCLTKRPERMPEYFTSNSDARIDTITMAIHELRASDPERYDRAVSEWMNRGFCDGKGPLPLPNVWLGTSVENQKVKPRIDHLRQCPAAVRFLSLEPLLEDIGTLDLSGIHWVVVGGESGPHARPMHPGWVRSVRDQCQEAGVSFFFKQMSKKAKIPADLMIRQFPEVNHA